MAACQLALDDPQRNGNHAIFAAAPEDNQKTGQSVAGLKRGFRSSK
jgi:hypothetical protein